MQLEFPYQIVTFLDREPEPNEPVYYGVHGWYPQIALKRRFKLGGISEENFIQDLRSFFDAADALTVTAGDLIKPERMPVQVIHINNQNEVKSFHTKILGQFGKEIVSRYPDREGENYYPHITAEFNGEFVIPTDRYTNRQFNIANIWLLKDVTDENSRAYMKIR